MKFFSNKGFTLIEIIFSLGMLGGIALGVMKVSKDAGKMTRYSEQRIDIDQSVKAIYSLLRTKSACEATLIGMDPTGAGSEVDEVKQNLPTGTTVAFSIGDILGTNQNPLYLKEMAISNYDANNQLAHFEVILNKGEEDIDSMSEEVKKNWMKKSVGGLLLKRTFPLQVEVDGSGNISKCLSENNYFISGLCSTLDGTLNDVPYCGNIFVKNIAGKPSITSEGDLTAQAILNISAKAEIGGDTTTDKHLSFNNLANITPGGSQGSLILSGNSSTNLGKLNLGTNSSIEGDGDNLTISSPTMLVKGKLNVNESATFQKKLKISPGVNATIEVSGNRIKLTNLDVEITGSNDSWQPASEENLIATRAWVYEVFNKLYRQDTLNKILSKATSDIENNPLNEFKKKICDSVDGHYWDSGSNTCRLHDSCGGGQYLQGHSNGNKICLSAPGTPYIPPAPPLPPPPAPQPPPPPVGITPHPNVTGISFNGPPVDRGLGQGCPDGKKLWEYFAGLDINILNMGFKAICNGSSSVISGFCSKVGKYGYGSHGVSSGQYPCYNSISGSTSVTNVLDNVKCCDP